MAVAGELVPAGGAVVLSGKAGRALELLEQGVLIDPDDRRNPRALEYQRDRLSPATRRAYRRWVSQYLYFCSVQGRRELPASDATLEDFMVWLAELQPRKGRNAGKGAGLSPAYMRQALAAVHYFHQAARESWPSTWLAQGIITTHAQRRAQAGVKDDVGVPPAKLPTLLELVRACPTDTHAGIRDRAMLLMGFQIMARRSELSMIDFDSVTETGDGLRVHVPQTKTNRLRGRVAMLAPWPEYPDVDPPAAVLAWRRTAEALGIRTGPFFRGVDRWDHVNGGPEPYAGVSGNGFRMDPMTVELVIARAAAEAVKAGAKMPNAAELRGHSLRAGGVTSSYEAGADILAIARQGGWGDRSPVIFRYIREVDLDKRNPMRLLGVAG